MTTDRDPRDRIVLSWLREDAHENAERVLLRALDEVDTTQQRRSWWPAWRFFDMNVYAKLAAAAAGVLLVAVVGYQLLPSKTGTGSAPTVAPSPTLAPSAAAGATSVAIPTIPGDGPVTAGTYVIDAARHITIDMPAGWSTCCEGIITKNDFAGIIYGDITGVTVYADSCKWKSHGQSTPTGASAFAAAFAAQVHRNSSDVREYTVGGMRAVHVRLTVPADQPMESAGEFAGCDEAKFQSWGDAGGGRYHQGPGQIDDLYLLDLDGGTYVFDVISGPSIPAADKADLGAMLASVQIN